MPGVKDANLLKAVCGAALRKSWKFNPQNLSSPVWAFAPLGVKDAHLLEAVRGAELRKIWE